MDPGRRHFPVPPLKALLVMKAAKGRRTVLRRHDLDLGSALKDGMPFFMSANGLIAPQYFRLVEIIAGKDVRYDQTVYHYN